MQGAATSVQLLPTSVRSNIFKGSCAGRDPPKYRQQSTTIAKSSSKAQRSRGAKREVDILPREGISTIRQNKRNKKDTYITSR